ncbi:hypothetical protein ACTXQV_44965, partial [Klebsiella pneumoniae]
LDNREPGSAANVLSRGLLFKIRYKDNAGLPARKKFFWTSVASLGAGITLYLIATMFRKWA